MGRGAYRRPGEQIVRRDVWHRRPVVGWGGVVVSDTDELLVLYMPERASLRFPPGDFFGAPRPWSARDCGHEHRVLQVRAEGGRLAARLDAGERWRSEDRASWRPDPSWSAPDLPHDWWERP